MVRQHDLNYLCLLFTFRHVTQFDIYWQCRWSTNWTSMKLYKSKTFLNLNCQKHTRLVSKLHRVFDKDVIYKVPSCTCTAHALDPIHWKLHLYNRSCALDQLQNEDTEEKTTVKSTLYNFRPQQSFPQLTEKWQNEQISKSPCYYSNRDKKPVWRKSLTDTVAFLKPLNIIESVR